MSHQTEVKAYWDMPVSAEQLQNRVDAQFVDHKEKTVIAVEVSCLWVENRMEKDIEKMRKYGPLKCSSIPDTHHNIIFIV